MIFQRVHDSEEAIYRDSCEGEHGAGDGQCLDKRHHFTQNVPVDSSEPEDVVCNDEFDGRRHVEHSQKQICHSHIHDQVVRDGPHTPVGEHDANDHHVANERDDQDDKITQTFEDLFGQIVRVVAHGLPRLHHRLGVVHLRDIRDCSLTEITLSPPSLDSGRPL